MRDGEIFSFAYVDYVGMDACANLNVFMYVNVNGAYHQNQKNIIIQQCDTYAISMCLAVCAAVCCLMCRAVFVLPR